jgi:hypothetical protein
VREQPSTPPLGWPDKNVGLVATTYSFVAQPLEAASGRASDSGRTRTCYPRLRSKFSVPSRPGSQHPRRCLRSERWGRAPSGWTRWTPQNASACPPWRTSRRGGWQRQQVSSLLQLWTASRRVCGFDLRCWPSSLVGAGYGRRGGCSGANAAEVRVCNVASRAPTEEDASGG